MPPTGKIWLNVNKNNRWHTLFEYATCATYVT